MCNFILCIRVSPVTQMVKNLPAMQETQVQSLGWEDPLEKEIGYTCHNARASFVPQTLKNPPAVQETCI